MPTSLPMPIVPIPVAPDAVDAGALARAARAFRQAALEGRLPPVMKGRKLGVLCDTPPQDEALMVMRAASELGAHVSLVHPGFDEASDGEAVLHAARTLGRLYDVVACLAMSPAFVRQLRAAAGIPVLDDADVATGLVRTIDGDDVGPHGPASDDLHFAWQAALAASLG